MSQSPLNSRKDALEHEFFSRQDQEAIEKMRAKNAVKAKREALTEASGITDESVLDALDAAGIQAETLTALSLVPLVAVAWADGEMDDGERSAIQEAAAKSNADASTLSLLEGWLSAPPSASLLETWKAYIQELQTTLDATAKRALRDQLIGGARQVAEAAGGFLGLGNKISKVEAQVLDELAACFHD